GGKGDLRGRVPVDPGILQRRRASGAGEGEISRSRGRAARDRGQWAFRYLPAARNRSLERYFVHRSPVQAQARPRAQEIHQGGKAGSRVIRGLPTFVMAVRFATGL